MNDWKYPSRGGYIYGHFGIFSLHSLSAITHEIQIKTGNSLEFNSMQQTGQRDGKSENIFL